MYILVSRVGDRIDAEGYYSIEYAREIAHKLKALWAAYEGCTVEELPSNYQVEIFEIGRPNLVCTRMES